MLFCHFSTGVRNISKTNKQTKQTKTRISMCFIDVDRCSNQAFRWFLTSLSYLPKPAKTVQTACQRSSQSLPIMAQTIPPAPSKHLQHIPKYSEGISKVYKKVELGNTSPQEQTCNTLLYLASIPCCN